MEEQIQLKLDDRLAAAASFVREGAVLADVGTDHAYIPVYLTKTGRVRYALAGDINRGPLERARQSAIRYGAEDRIAFFLSDGLHGMELERCGVTDIVIAGMGGELIARILAESPYVRRPDVRLILQPMTAADDLRQWLDANGFAVEEEKLAEAAGKIYCCLCASYDGTVRTSTPAERLLGQRAMEQKDPLFRRYAEDRLHRLQKQVAGMRKGGLDTAAEEACCREIEHILEETR